MKLRTEMRGKEGAKYVIGTPKNNTHDLLAAHALMQAIETIMEGPETREIIGLASELMREWGLDSGEDGK